MMALLFFLFLIERTHSWNSFQKFQANKERSNQCNLESTDIPFISKNPLIYELIPSEGQRPILIEGPGRPAITAIAAHKRKIQAMRQQMHYTLYFGREDGSIAKLVDISAMKAVIVENVHVFDSMHAITGIKIIENELNSAIIAVTYDGAARIPFQHCTYQTSCAKCIRLRDPHCAWDIDSLSCVYKKNWSRGNYIQNIITGMSEQCPDYVTSVKDHLAYSNKHVLTNIPKNITKGFFWDNAKGQSTGGKYFAYSNNNWSIIAIAIVLSAVFGFLVGYQISKWRVIHTFSRRPVGCGGSSSRDSSTSREYDPFVQSSSAAGMKTARFNRKDSLGNTIIVSKGSGVSSANENVYAPQAGKSSIISTSLPNADAVSIIFNTGISNPQFVPLPNITSTSNGGSGIATPRHETRTMMLLPNANGATLPRDYKVKKVYL